ncbi:HGL334Wp [Eremothecium sinecaudum]|uniref:HGL334Wp n=1 Tax=Eremothecium sinecaudum TaxID=45286 RepID=A0A109UZY7_9SACH|nr:HGL334Wp [Eremothecium sinecaudum]AMD22006.1 HGL334Wp [Eremothecium sinecaudum]
MEVDREMSVDMDASMVEQTPAASEGKVVKPETAGVNTNTQGKKVPQHLLEKRRLGRIKAAEEFARKLKKIGIEKQDNVHISQTGLFRALPLINQKNYSSDYLRKDDQIFSLRERKSLRSGNLNAAASNSQQPMSLAEVQEDDLKTNGEEDATEDTEDTNTIVIHPGSSCLKIGLSTDVFPLSIPTSVAVPRNSPAGLPAQPRYDKHEEFMEHLEHIQSDFKERMRYYKRKIIPNSHEQVMSFNSKSIPDKIHEHNDLYRIEWIKDNKAGKKVYYGEEAERCLPEYFAIRHPFADGSFNTDSSDYNSLQELLNDVVNFLTFALSNTKLNISRSQFSNYKVVLIIPDLFEKNYVEQMMRLLIYEMKFQAVALVQESLASCYGAGISNSTCVIDIGASGTKISCVDEGQVIQNSCIRLSYGGDDITRLFAELMLQSKFPYQDWNLYSRQGWILAEQLKKNHITFQDADVAVQLSNFLKRDPKVSGAEKYEFKLFNEVMVSPMAFFYPQILSILKPPVSNNKYLDQQFPQSLDPYNCKPDNPQSISQLEALSSRWYTEMNKDLDIIKKLISVTDEVETISTESSTNGENASIKPQNLMPLEKAIIQSITNAAVLLGDNMSKLTNFYSNLLIVGGSSVIPGLDAVLKDRINIWRPRFLSVSTLPVIFKKVNDMVKQLENEIKKNNVENEEEIVQSRKKLIKSIKIELENYWESLDPYEHVYPIMVLPPPREMDPSMLTWKGGSVFGRIKLCEELYITEMDWEMLGSRILKYKCIFDY